MRGVLISEVVLHTSLCSWDSRLSSSTKYHDDDSNDDDDNDMGYGIWESYLIWENF